ncbi:ROK family protein [Streptomyces sp. NPDC020141]|uniref:ROK family transcriptional regulator n=1 Tax=Streptomyces sp. NPDC020141 TaxID=3365065 RepID=UPI0037B5C63E
MGGVRVRAGRTGSGTGVNLAALRGFNAALVLDLLRAAGEGGISRLELAARTGLTPQAVSKITARLRAEGLAAEAGRRASTGGKPRTVWRLVPSAAHAVGVRLGRDELTAVLLDLAGDQVAARVAPLDPGAEPERVAGAVAHEVRSLLGSLPTAAARETGNATGRGDGPGWGAGPGAEGTSGAVGAAGAMGAPGPEGGSGPEGGRRPSRPGDRPALLGVGVAVPGPFDHASGVPGRAAGDADGHPLRSALSARLGGLPVVLDNDTNAAALALRREQPGSFAYLHLGTGLGAALVLGGGLHRGTRTRAGEFGHQVIQLDGPLCRCGRRGCVESLCLDAARRGDTARSAHILGVGAANLAGLFDIDRVLLGGRLVRAEPAVHICAVRAACGIPVALAGGGPHLIAHGAAHLILAPVFGD